jgi:hypothetical protein
MPGLAAERAREPAYNVREKRVPGRRAECIPTDTCVREGDSQTSPPQSLMNKVALKFVRAGEPNRLDHFEDLSPIQFADLVC